MSCLSQIAPTLPNYGVIGLAMETASDPILTGGSPGACGSLCFAAAQLLPDSPKTMYCAHSPQKEYAPHCRRCGSPSVFNRSSFASAIAFAPISVGGIQQRSPQLDSDPTSGNRVHYRRFNHSRVRSIGTSVPARTTRRGPDSIFSSDLRG